MISLVEFLTNTSVALALGVVIGMERQWRQHPAGLKTNALVSVGSALFVAIAMLSENESSPTRVAAQVVSGLGFLGGGVILREGMNIHGLNTAATLWCSGAVGALAGSGFIIQSILGTGLLLVVHLCFRPLIDWIATHSRNQPDSDCVFSLRIFVKPGEMDHVRDFLLRQITEQRRFLLQGVTSKKGKKRGGLILADIYARSKTETEVDQLVQSLSSLEQVRGVSWKRNSN